MPRCVRSPLPSQRPVSLETGRRASRKQGRSLEPPLPCLYSMFVRGNNLQNGTAQYQLISIHEPSGCALCLSITTFWKKKRVLMGQSQPFSSGLKPRAFFPPFAPLSECSPARVTRARSAKHQEDMSVCPSTGFWRAAGSLLTLI